MGELMVAIPRYSPDLIPKFTTERNTKTMELVGCIS